jgi:cytochrome P450
MAVELRISLFKTLPSMLPALLVGKCTSPADSPTDYLTRAVDNSSNRLPTENMAAAITVATGAGSTTTSSLLSWLIFRFVTYPGMQELLVQELVTYDSKDDEDVTPDLIEEQDELDKYVKVDHGKPSRRTTH